MVQIRVKTRTEIQRSHLHQYINAVDTVYTGLAM